MFCSAKRETGRWRSSNWNESGHGEQNRKKECAISKPTQAGQRPWKNRKIKPTQTTVLLRKAHSNTHLRAPGGRKVSTEKAARKQAEETDTDQAPRAAAEQTR